MKKITKAATPEKAIYIDDKDGSELPYGGTTVKLSFGYESCRDGESCTYHFSDKNGEKVLKLIRDFINNEA